ncbi:hypothetical protein HanPSC8_Chr05g0215371 [Helianthus annuus]|nr:hypothetical protein HanPSC8_Chr05g0215371 [Helianthus annuus]
MLQNYRPCRLCRISSTTPSLFKQNSSAISSFDKQCTIPPCSTSPKLTCPLTIPFSSVIRILRTLIYCNGFPKTRPSFLTLITLFHKNLDLKILKTHFKVKYVFLKINKVSRLHS